MGHVVSFRKTSEEDIALAIGRHDGLEVPKLALPDALWEQFTAYAIARDIATVATQRHGLFPGIAIVRSPYPSDDCAALLTEERGEPRITLISGLNISA